MTTALVSSTDRASSAARAFNRPALTKRIVPINFIANRDQVTANGNIAPKAIADGHTTGGTREISDQVGAVPLEDRNCRNPEKGGSSREEAVRRDGCQS